MRIVIGRGRNRRVFELGSPSTRTREETERMTQDLINYCLRPAILRRGSFS